jgi:mono/diheme cytochrome c family protein
LIGKPQTSGSKALCLALVLCGTLFVGCRQDMHDQPKIEPYEENAFFADGVGSRQPPAGTVARGNLRADTHLYQGADATGNVLDALPASIELGEELLRRGQERYEIFCSVCHGLTGAGDGMIVRRGFKQPPPFTEDRLVAMPLGYYFDVMTNGFGVMSSYAKQVPVDDRWAIAAYIRALQLSQSAVLAELPAELGDDMQQGLEEQAAAEHEDGHGGDGHGGDGHGEDTHGGDH